MKISFISLGTDTMCRTSDGDVNRILIYNKKGGKIGEYDCLEHRLYQDPDACMTSRNMTAINKLISGLVTLDV